MIIIRNEYSQENGERSYHAFVDMNGNCEEICIEVYTLFKCLLLNEPEMLNACISSILPEVTENLNTCSEDKMACFIDIIERVERNSIYDQDNSSYQGGK